MSVSYEVSNTYTFHTKYDNILYWTMLYRVSSVLWYFILANCCMMGSVIMYIDQASMCFVIGRRESYPQLYFINTLPVMNLIQFHHIRCIMACLRITFVCLHITQYHYHHCANVFECIEHVCQVNSAMCVTKINSKVRKLNGQLMA